MTTEQRVLVFDCETAPLTVYTWGLKDQFISNNQVIKDWYIIAWSAKWLGDPPSKIMYFDQRNKKNMTNDKELVGKIWKLLDEADIVVTQNGKNFDSTKLNARFIEHGMKPPSPYTHLDTYQILKKVASFSSNSLEFLSKKLCTKYKKLSHGKFPGMSLWVECLKGNKAAWNEMKKYNIHDVLSTEELYMKIRAWTPQTAPKVFIDKLRVTCTVCGSQHTRSEGIRFAGERPYRRIHCLTCGHWDKGTIK
jgi:DNA polymerase elongation subunit (family B)